MIFDNFATAYLAVPNAFSAKWSLRSACRREFDRPKGISLFKKRIIRDSPGASCDFPWIDVNVRGYRRWRAHLSVGVAKDDGDQEALQSVQQVVDRVIDLGPLAALVRRPVDRHHEV